MGLEAEIESRGEVREHVMDGIPGDACSFLLSSMSTFIVPCSITNKRHSAAELQNDA